MAPRVVAEVLRPYRGWLAIILLATGAETAASLAAPWPSKIVLDNVIEGREPIAWIRRITTRLATTTRPPGASR